MQSIFTGIWVPIVTPFRGDEIDHQALTRIARYLRDQSASGLVAGATTGEGALLTADEQADVFAVLRNAVPTLPIVLGLNQPATRQAAQMASELAQLRPDGLLVTPPSYTRPGQAGICRHFEAIATAADLPILVYNIPYRTGVNIELDTLQALARDPRIVGIKECGGSIERMLRLVHETPLRVLAGEDNQVFAALCVGAHGAISASAHIQPRLHVRLLEAVRQGDLATARRIAVALRPMVADVFAEPNPAPLKAYLAQEGWCEAAVRLPFLPASDALGQRLQTHASVLAATM